MAFRLAAHALQTARTALWISDVHIDPYYGTELVCVHMCVRLRMRVRACVVATLPNSPHLPTFNIDTNTCAHTNTHTHTYTTTTTSHAYRLHADTPMHACIRLRT